MTTLDEAKQDLYEMLVANATTGQPRSELSLAARVYKGEPTPGQMLGPLAITITTSSIEPSEFVFVLRAYAQLATGALLQQQRLDQLVYTLEQYLDGKIPRNNWTWAYSEQLDALIAECSLSYPRDDF